MDRRYAEFLPLADAELVTFGIGHRDPHARPLCSSVQNRRSHLLELRCNILALVAHSYVEVETVLHRFRFRNQLEQNAGAFRMLRIADGRTFTPDENSLERRGVGFLGVTSSDEASDEVFVARLRCPPECRGPPLRLFVRVRRIYCDLKFVSHVPTLTPTTDTKEQIRAGAGSQSTLLMVFMVISDVTRETAGSPLSLVTMKFSYVARSFTATRMK